MIKKRRLLSILLALAIIVSTTVLVNPISAQTIVNVTTVMMKYSAADGSRPNYIFELAFNGDILPVGEDGDNYTNMENILYNNVKLSDIYGAAIQWAPVDSGAGRANKIYIHIPKSTYEESESHAISFGLGVVTPFTQSVAIAPVVCAQSYSNPYQWNATYDSNSANISLIAAEAYQGGGLDRYLIRFAFDTAISDSGSGDPLFGKYNSDKLLINGKPYSNNANWPGVSIITTTIMQIYVVSPLYNDYTGTVRTIEVKKGFVLPNGRVTTEDFKAILNDGESNWQIRSAVVQTAATDITLYQRGDSGPNYIFTATFADKILPIGTSGGNYTVPSNVLFNGIPLSDASLNGAAVQWTPDVLGAEKASKILIFIPKGPYESASVRTISFSDGFVTPYGTLISSKTFKEAYNEKYLSSSASCNVDFAGAPVEQASLTRHYVDIQFESDIASGADIGSNPLFGRYNSNLLLFNGQIYSNNSWNGISVLGSMVIRIYIDTALYNSYTGQRELTVKQGFILPNGKQTDKDFTVLYNPDTSLWNPKFACTISTYSTSNDGLNTITGIAANSSVTDFMQKVVMAKNVSFVAKNGANVAIAGNDLVGTGTKLSFYNPDLSLYKTFTIVIYGDVDGTGSIDVSDMALIKLHLLNNIILTDDYAKAANINRNNSITISDLLSIKRSIINLQPISQQ